MARDSLHINNYLTVVIEGDETVSADRLRVALSDDMPHVDFVFACRSTPGYAEPIKKVTDAKYVSIVYEAFKLTELVMSVQTRGTDCIARFVHALDRPDPDHRSAASSLKALAVLAGEALQELSQYGHGNTQALPPQGEARPTQGNGTDHADDRSRAELSVLAD